MIRKGVAIGLLATAAFAVCGTAAGGQDTTTGGTAPAADANLYIVRFHALPLYAVAVKVDGKKVTSLYNGQYTAVHVSPGRHEVAISWPLIAVEPGGKTEIEVGVDRPVYVEFRGDTDVVGPVITRQFSLGVLTEPNAGDEIRSGCKFKPPKGD